MTTKTMSSKRKFRLLGTITATAGIVTTILWTTGVIDGRDGGLFGPVAVLAGVGVLCSNVLCKP